VEICKHSDVFLQVYRTQAMFGHVMKACRDYIESHRAALVTVSFEPFDCWFYRFPL